MGKPFQKKATFCLKHHKEVKIIAKIIEKAIASRLLEHMVKNNLLKKMQSAYRSGHSTERVLLHINNKISMALDNQKHVFLVLLNVLGAFDTGDHKILLSFLKDYVGLSNSALNMFKSYLYNRTQCVSIGNIVSHLSEVSFGIPQGSVLGPLFFCIYTIPLGAILCHMTFHISFMLMILSCVVQLMQVLSKTL